MSKYIKFLIVFFTVFVVFSILHAHIFASSQESTGVIISPPIFSNLTANPGDTLINEIKVYNTSPNILNANILVDNYVPVGKYGAVKLTNPNVSTDYSLASWVSVSPSSISVAPGSFQYVKFAINVPINAQPGSKFASIVVSIAPSSNGTSGSGIGTEIGSLILLTVSGNVNVSASLKSFQVFPYFSRNSVIHFNQTIEDTGDVTIKPYGKIVISNIFNHIVKVIPIEELDVIPQAERVSSETINGKGLFGIYRASLFVNYNSEGKGGTLVGNSTFIVIPIFKIIGVLILLALIFIFRRNIIRALKVLFSKNPEM